MKLVHLMNMHGLVQYPVLFSQSHWSVLNWRGAWPCLYSGLNPICTHLSVHLHHIFFAKVNLSLACLLEEEPSAYPTVLHNDALQQYENTFYPDRGFTIECLIFNLSLNCSKE